MSRIPMPAASEAAPTASQPFLEGTNKQIGSVPNMFRMLANSPAALRGYLGLSGALAKGTIGAQTRERIALAVAEINGCDYCLSSHTSLGRLAKLDDAEITANRSGASNDLKADAALRFAAKIVRTRGHVTDADVSAFRAAGYTNEQVVEVTVLVALSTLRNYVNEVAGTDIDFPVIHARNAA